MHETLADPMVQRVAAKVVEREVKKQLPLVMKRIAKM